MMYLMTVAAVVAAESMADGGVDGSLATLADAGAVVGAALLRAAVDGVSGLARRAVEVGGGLVPVAAARRWTMMASTVTMSMTVFSIISALAASFWAAVASRVMDGFSLR